MRTNDKHQHASNGKYRTIIIFYFPGKKISIEIKEEKISIENFLFYVPVPSVKKKWALKLDNGST